MGVDLPGKPVPPGDPHTVAVIARLVEKKGIHVLIEAWPQVRAAVPDARLIIGGDGPWHERLRQQAAGDEGIELRGYVAGEAKVALEAQAGIVAAPSIVGGDGDADGLPVAVLEALARGAFVVASDASGAQDLLRGADAGTVVRAGDVNALAQALIVAMTQGESEREAARASALSLATTVTWDALAPELLSLMRDVER